MLITYVTFYVSVILDQKLTLKQQCFIAPLQRGDAVMVKKRLARVVTVDRFLSEISTTVGKVPFRHIFHVSINGLEPDVSNFI